MELAAAVVAGAVGFVYGLSWSPRTVSSFLFASLGLLCLTLGIASRGGPQQVFALLNTVGGSLCAVALAIRVLAASTGRSFPGVSLTRLAAAVAVCALAASVASCNGQILDDAFVVGLVILFAPAGLNAFLLWRMGNGRPPGNADLCEDTQTSSE